MSGRGASEFRVKDNGQNVREGTRKCKINMVSSTEI